MTVQECRDEPFEILLRVPAWTDRATLRGFLTKFRAGELHGAPIDVAQRFSRRAQTREFAQLLDEVLLEQRET